MPSAEDLAAAEYGAGHRGVTAMAEVMGAVPTPPTNAFRHAATELLFQHVWSRPQLTRKRRRWIALTAAGFVAAPHAIEAHVAAALGGGDIDRAEFGEFLLTVACYCGWPRANVLDDAATAFLRRSHSADGDDPPWPAFTRIRRLEPGCFDTDGRSPLAAVWGGFEADVLWQRPQLDAGDRRIVAVVGLAAQHGDAAVRRHVRAAIDGGEVSSSEWAEVALQAAFYAGAEAGALIDEAAASADN